MAQFVSLFSGEQPVATGLGVVERGWLGVFCVVSSPQYRQLGFAKGIMHVLAQWGKDQGAEHIYLQVMDNNPPALNLYRKLGFTPRYQYYYAEKDGHNEIDH